MTREEFYRKYYPFALKTRYPIFALAQWSWETDFGRNNGTKFYNNLAGIKWVSASTGKKATTHPYAVYDSLNDFVEDYNRVMNLSFYDNIFYWLDKGNYWEAINALNVSPYSEADYNQNEMIKRINEIRDLNLVSLNNDTEFDSEMVQASKNIVNASGFKLDSKSGKITAIMLLVGAITIILIGDD